MFGLISALFSPSKKKKSEPEEEKEENDEITVTAPPKKKKARKERGEENEDGNSDDDDTGNPKSESQGPKEKKRRCCPIMLSDLSANEMSRWNKRPPMKEVYTVDDLPVFLPCPCYKSEICGAKKAIELRNYLNEEDRKRCIIYFDDEGKQHQYTNDAEMVTIKYRLFHNLNEAFPYPGREAVLEMNEKRMKEKGWKKGHRVKVKDMHPHERFGKIQAEIRLHWKKDHGPTASKGERDHLAKGKNDAWDIVLETNPALCTFITAGKRTDSSMTEEEKMQAKQKASRANVKRCREKKKRTQQQPPTASI